MRRSVVVLLAAGFLVAGAVAPPASAAPGDPLPGWEPRPEEAHREVSVAPSGRVFVDANSEPGYKPISYLEHGYRNDWVRTETEGASWAGLATGADGYAVDVRFTVDGPARYRVHDGEAWSDIATFYDGEVREATMDANSAGDVAVVLKLSDPRRTMLARLPHGGEWVVQELRYVYTDYPADVVINEQGKTTAVWAVGFSTPTDYYSRIVRTSVRAGTTSEGRRQLVGTVNRTGENTQLHLAIDSDGRGRETIIARNRVWRQPHTSEPHEYQMRIGIRGLLATGESTTRVVWPVATETGYSIRSVRFEDSGRRPQTTLWSHALPPSQCRTGAGIGAIALGIGMVPGGRSYVAAGIERGVDSDGVCPDIASFLVVDRRDSVLNEQPLGYFAVGDEFQVAAAAAGPVVVEFKNWDDHADPISEDQPDGRYSMQFFNR
ncbi:hypothetical protein [Promicromonospora panici]|uniref:hypothetical protein n=1 Tax=Promicromonospora panici TaxID=2219658 RepID=UPI00101B8278|nr:hypothetical protein [Promicromonospora panici]